MATTTQAGIARALLLPLCFALLAPRVGSAAATEQAPAASSSLRLVSRSLTPSAPGCYNALYVQPTGACLHSGNNVSTNNGRTWQTGPMSPDFVSGLPHGYRRDPVTSALDPFTGRLITILNALDTPGLDPSINEPPVAQETYYLRYRVSVDSGQSWRFDEPIVQVIWFREEQIRLPQAQPGSQGQQIAWLPATVSRVHQMLRNPSYAGAFVYGRTGTQTRLVAGRAQRRASRLAKSMEQWEVLIREHHPVYLGWEQYLKNRRLMAQNRVQWAGEAGGAARRGAALLSGLLRCGRCGRKLQVRYRGREGQVARYHCRGNRGQRGSDTCLSLGSLRADAAVVAELLAAVEPAGIAAACEASQQTQQQEQEKRRAVELALEKARYEAQRAQRQFDAVEPENRLVTAELEGRWNQALAQVSALESRLQALALDPVPAISAEQQQRLGELGRDLKRLWEEPQAPVELKKRLLRTVIEEIVVTTPEPPAEHRLQIHRAGGVHTELRVPRNPRGMHGRVADRSLIELVRELAPVCDDQTIAAVLNRLGFTTGQGNGWRMARVTSISFH